MFKIFKKNSGKDRTGMSVSLEQCLIMVRCHNLENSLTQYVLDDLRRLFSYSDIGLK